MKLEPPIGDTEARWPVMLAITVALTILALLPDELRMFPPWFSVVILAIVLLPIIAVILSTSGQLWTRIERVVVLAFVAVVLVLLLVHLGTLIAAMIARSAKATGPQLLSASVGLWLMNVLLFSLLHWQIDRGGPEARARKWHQSTPDWLLPHEVAPSGDVPPDRRPTFIDYLYLSFSTATAFSATDMIPLTDRAKLLLMLESTISLSTVVLIASRAINVLNEP